MLAIINCFFSNYFVEERPLDTNKDKRERDNLPLCMDWHNYSSKWLAYHCLGFPKILMRLLAGEEITASDPDVMRMNQNALLSRTHVKSILNLTVRSDCLEKPLWLN